MARDRGRQTDGSRIGEVVAVDLAQVHVDHLARDDDLHRFIERKRNSERARIAVGRPGRQDAKHYAAICEEIHDRADRAVATPDDDELIPFPDGIAHDLRNARGVAHGVRQRQRDSALAQ